MIWRQVGTDEQFWSPLNTFTTVPWVAGTGCLTLEDVLVCGVYAGLILLKPRRAHFCNFIGAPSGRNPALYA